MMNNQLDLNILILDDEKDFTDELHEYLVRNSMNAFRSYTASEAYSILDNKSIDILILDVKLKHTNGIEVLKIVKKLYSGIEVIMISGFGDIDKAVKMLRLGAIDFIPKPTAFSQIKLAIERTNKFVQLSKRLKQFHQYYSKISIDMDNSDDYILFNDNSLMQNVLDSAFQAGKHDNLNVLISGESGTGKELVAKAIHKTSSRKNNSFIAVNCAAVPVNLMENEFFGHEKGAFTNAEIQTLGYFELADNGTLFLDEISEMPLKMQSKILRAIEEKKIKKIGSYVEVSVDVRVIAATNQNLNKMVDEEKFRLDLFHRINILSIDIPPLRERCKDIELLANYFIKVFAKKFNRKPLLLEKKLIDKLKRYSFPGNVRELKNMIERAMILCREEVVTESFFNLGDSAAFGNLRNFNLEHNEMQLLKNAFDFTENNQVKTAKILGISRDTLIRKMKKYNLFINKNCLIKT